MPVPNTLTRTLDLAHPQEEVWSALTTLDGLTGWFGGHAEGWQTELDKLPVFLDAAA